jgi:hypothetical protein
MLQVGKGDSYVFYWSLDTFLTKKKDFVQKYSIKYGILLPLVKVESHKLSSHEESFAKKVPSKINQEHFSSMAITFLRVRLYFVRHIHFLVIRTIKTPLALLLRVLTRF